MQKKLNNPFAKLVRSRTYRPKVLKSKKFYDRNKEKDLSKWPLNKENKMTKLCPRGKAAAKRKFKVYPSAYANAYASKICAGKIKDPSGVKRKDFRGPKPAAKGAMIKAKEGAYMGSYIKSEIDGKKISNKSYEKYYKGMIDV